jgi:hypothetical protein
MSFKEKENPTSHILTFFVQNALFLTPRITWTSLIQNPMLVLFLFLDIPLLVKLIEFIIMEYFVMKNLCMLPLRKLKMIKLMRF